MLSAFSSIGHGVRAFSSGVSSAVSQFTKSVFPESSPSNRFVIGQRSVSQASVAPLRPSVLTHSPRILAGQPTHQPMAKRGLGSLLFAGALSLLGCQNDTALMESTEVWADCVQEPEQISELDVLVVLDTSCSMSDDFERVGSGMATLQEDIDGLVDDSKFAFITTDPEDPDFHGPYDSSEVLDIVMAPGLLAEQINDEAGFASMYSWYNSGQSFIRPGASLLVFFISDEEEQSGLSPALWHGNFFTQIKVDEQGNLQPDKMDVVAITTIPSDPAACQSTYSTSFGCNYADLVRGYYDKEPVDLMLPSWEGWLSGQSFLTARVDQVALEHQPITSSLSVFLNDEDQPLPASEWDYDVDGNLLRLNFTPEFGDSFCAVYKY